MIMSTEASPKCMAASHILTRLGLVGTSAINTDSYLDLQIEIIKSIDWKKSTILDKVKIFMHMGEATLDYYDEFVSEPDDQKRINALVDATLIAWRFAIKEYNLKVPMYVTMFEDKIVRFVLTAMYMFIKDKQWKKVEAPVVVAP